MNVATQPVQARHSPTVQSRTNPNTSVTLAYATLLLTWGVMAFGATYPWAYTTLAVGIVVSAVGAPRWTTVARRGLTLVVFILLILACGAQLLSLPRETLTRLSPGTTQFLNAVNVAYAAGAIERHPVSIDPGQTIRGLAFIVFGTVWTITCTGFAQRINGFPRALARNLVVLGVAIGTIGLAQKATFNGKLLWFWEPMFTATNGFGPFVNRNHFAGWMLLVLTLSVGYLFGRFSSRQASTALTWRDRLLWFGSPEGTPAILTAIAILVMACALVWTMSRSGIAGAAVAIGVLSGAAIYRAKRRALRFVLAGYLLLTVVGVIAWRGADTLVDWYGNTNTLEWRIDLWKDTLPALKDFWVTGSGLNTYGTLMLAYPRTDVSVRPVEAHNDYLQLAVEGGLLLGIPVFLLIVAVSRTAVRRLRQPQDEMTWWIRMGAVAGICGMAVQELTEFSLQIPGVALLFATCVALAVHEPMGPPARRRSTSATSLA